MEFQGWKDPLELQHIDIPQVYSEIVSYSQHWRVDQTNTQIGTTQCKEKYWAV